MTGGAGIDEPFGARAADFDDPFEILEACHARIARMLRTLERLPAHVSAHGVDDEAREAIARGMPRLVVRLRGLKGTQYAHDFLTEISSNAGLIAAAKEYGSVPDEIERALEQNEPAAPAAS